MNFRTQVELPEKETEIRHSDRMMLFGSCFAENIGILLQENKFRCDVNPFGILYNPLSVAEAVCQILSHKVYEADDLFCSDGRWHSYMHHSLFSGATAGECLSAVNARLSAAAAGLPQTDWMVFTWGTAWVYSLKSSGKVVGNCHKQPERLFDRRLLSVDEIVDAYVALIGRLRQANKDLKVLLTVSPIRHAKDGMHGNQVNKSTLLLAVEALRKRCSDCHYFPSYEIMMDELRDYRFYADDMLHPSGKAVSYIWECFGKAYFSAETRCILDEWKEIRNGLNHKPFDAQSEAYRKFLTQIVLKINRLKEKLPYFDVQKELEQCRDRLKV